MKERFVEIATPNGRMEAFVTHPEAEGRFPAVIVCMDVFGLREELYDIARRVGTVGYYAMVPDFYHRHGKIRLNFPTGRTWTLADIGPEQEQKARNAGKATTNAMVVEDTGAILKFLKGEPVHNGPKGSIGFCMGGRHALCVAGHYPEAFRATASLHGSNMVSDAPDAPFRLAKKFRGEIYCGFAENDPLAPMSTINTLAEILTGDVKYHWQHHKGAKHGYALPNRDVSHKQAANRDWEEIFAMFRRQLPSQSG